MSFLMIPLTFLYDEYIDRPKLSEKKTHLSIQFLPPQKWSRNKTFIDGYILTVVDFIQLKSELPMKQPKCKLFELTIKKCRLKDIFVVSVY